MSQSLHLSHFFHRQKKKSPLSNMSSLTCLIAPYTCECPMDQILVRFRKCGFLQASEPWTTWGFNKTCHLATKTYYSQRSVQGQEKHRHYTSCGQKWLVWQPPLFAPPIPTPKVLVDPFSAVFPGNEAHNFLLAAPMRMEASRGQEVYVEKVVVLFLSCSVLEKLVVPWQTQILRYVLLECQKITTASIDQVS